MRKRVSRWILVLILIMAGASLSGCTLIFQKGRRVDVEKISKLKSELSELERAKAELEERLKKEIGDKEVTVDMLEKGLVITFLSEVLFDSGKADLRKESFVSLDNLAEVLNTTVRNLSIGVEGHTDNEPIKHSGWKSNWHLSAARALSVLEYLINNKGVAPQRLSILGYGEFRPIDSNETKRGRQRNRRVEVVILPKATQEGR